MTPFNLPPERFWYAYTKLKAEAVAAEFVAAGLDVVTLNPAVIVGPGDLNAISGSFILETARLQWLLPMSSGGISVIDVRDVARAHLAASERGQPGERYILSAANLSYREWFGMIAAACAVRPPLVSMPDWLLSPTARLIDGLRLVGIQTPMDANQTRLGSAQVYFDAGKAERELGAPQIDIANSLRDTYDWYQQRGYIKDRLADAADRLVLAPGARDQILEERQRPIQHPLGVELHADNATVRRFDRFNDAVRGARRNPQSRAQVQQGLNMVRIGGHSLCAKNRP